MPRLNWITALFLVLTPIGALVWGGLHVSAVGIRPAEVLVFLVYYSFTAVSITAGYHRLFAHGAYDCRRFVKVVYLLCGAATFQHSVLTWVSDHRRHHQHIDTDADPYNIRRGFWWAHIGWLMVEQEPADFSNVRDLSADPLIRLQHRFYMPLAIFMSFGVPLGVGLVMGNPWGCLLWGGLIRTVVGHHATFLVNSLAHTLGSKPYSRAVSARDSVVTAVLTFGEGYHNFHHRFATDYRNGVHRHQWDPTKWLIRGMASIGWAWNLYRAPRERIVAARVECETQTLLDACRDRSQHVIAAARERLASVSASLEATAKRLGAAERARARHAWGAAKRDYAKVGWSELRAARRDFRAAWRQWRAELETLRATDLQSA